MATETTKYRRAPIHGTDAERVAFARMLQEAGHTHAYIAQRLRITQRHLYRLYARAAELERLAS